MYFMGSCMYTVSVCVCALKKIENLSDVNIPIQVHVVQMIV